MLLKLVFCFVGVFFFYFFPLSPGKLCFNRNLLWSITAGPYAELNPGSAPLASGNITFSILLIIEYVLEETLNTAHDA